MKASAEVKKFLSEAGRKGGASTSKKKVEAVRENGKKGGRPKGAKNGTKKSAK